MATTKRPTKKQQRPPAKKQGKRRPDKGEYRSFFVAMVDDPDWIDLGPEATAVLWVLKAKLGRAQIDVIDVEVIPKRAKLSLEQVELGLQELEEERWIVRDRNVIWIRNGLRYDPNEPLLVPNHRTSIEHHLLSLPKLPIVVEFADYYELGLPPDLRAEIEPLRKGSRTHAQPMRNPSATPAENGPEKSTLAQGLAKGSASRKTEDVRRKTDGSSPENVTEPESAVPEKERSQLAAAANEFCERTGASWRLPDRPIDAWADQLPAKFPALSTADIVREIEKAADWYVGEGRKVKAPHQAIRNWLEKAKPSKNGDDGDDEDDYDAFIRQVEAELM